MVWEAGPPCRLGRPARFFYEGPRSAADGCQVMRLRFRCDKIMSRTGNKLSSSDVLLNLPPLVPDNT